MADNFQQGKNEAARGYSRPDIKPTDHHTVKEQKQWGFNTQKQQDQIRWDKKNGK